MENKNKNLMKIATIVIAALMISSTPMMFSSFLTPTVSAQTSTSGLLQYEWPQLGGSGGWTLNSSGPAPNTPTVAWTRQVTGLSAGFAGTLTAFNGLVFATTTTTVTAFDAFTGQTVWTYTQANANFQSSPTKLDNTYMFLDGDTGAGGLGIGTTAGLITNETVTVLSTATGTFVSNFTVVGVGFQPGAGGYFPGRFDPATHMKYVRGYNAQTNQLSYYAINLTTPTAPSLGWKTILDESGEDLSVGGGVLLVGTVNGAVLALNETTGVVVWRALKVGFAQYTATYIASDNTFIQGSASTTLTCYNATNGAIVWDVPQGGRAFFAFAGATAYGRYYQHNIAVPQGYVGCWDVNTGDLLWKQPALYQIGYITPVVADGKLYLQRTSGTAAGVAAEVTEFACYDAFTGDLLWQMPGTSIVNPSIAYGNLYAIINNFVYCFSDQTPQDWNMWRGNLEQPGIVQSTAPYGNSTNGFNPAFTFKTNGSITSSPAVVAGKVYFGSQDRNIYCVDANTGAEIWNFTIGSRVFSSPAVVGGKVFTGADDGSIYALDANTGRQIWKTFAGGLTDFVFAGTWQPRSSPIVANGRVYVGALDGKLYCLDTNTGTVLWSDLLGSSTRPIGGSPAYNNGYVYICATNHNIYKIDASNGAIIWTTTSNATIARAYTDFFPWSTPVVFNNTVYWGAGPVYGILIWYALNANTGKQIWNVTSSATQTPDVNSRFLGNSPVCQTPVVLQWNSSLSIMIAGENLGVVIRNANNGSKIWYQFLGHEVYSSVAYANDSRTPKFYIGSDTYSITCFNATAAVRNDSVNAVMTLFTSLSHIQSSPTVWGGNLYVTSADDNLYMFKDITNSPMSLSVTSNKGSTMWNNETILFAGRLNPTPTTDYGSFASNGLPNATVGISLTKPDGTSINLTATTDALGYFTTSYQPTDLGQWGWVAYYNGQTKPDIIYNPSYTQFQEVNVTQAPNQSTPTIAPSETPTATPTATITPTATVAPTATPKPATDYTVYYVLIAVIVIVVIVVGAYMFMRRGKKA